RQRRARALGDCGCRFTDARPDRGKAAVGAGDIAGRAGRSGAVEEKPAADQDVMARAQAVTRPLSSTPLPSGLLLGGKLPPLLRSGTALPAGYEPSLLHSAQARSSF